MQKIHNLIDHYRKICLFPNFKQHIFLMFLLSDYVFMLHQKSSKIHDSSIFGGIVSVSNLTLVWVLVSNLTHAKSAPDWRVQCSGVRTGYCGIGRSTQFIWGLQIQSKPYDSGFATHTFGWLKPHSL